MEELVVLVNEQNNEIGTAPKDTVHTSDTPLHRGFSLFLFNSKNELLVTKRASSKKTFPGVWSNTICGHPGQGESASGAARRRLKEELGIELEKGSELREIQGLTPYRYRFADSRGIVENEICPILVAYSDINPSPNPDEISDWKWIPWEAFLKDIQKDKDKYSPWCIEEALILQKTHFHQ